MTNVSINKKRSQIYRLFISLNILVLLSFLGIVCFWLKRIDYSTATLSIISMSIFIPGLILSALLNNLIQISSKIKMTKFLNNLLLYLTILIFIGLSIFDYTQIILFSKKVNINSNVNYFFHVLNIILFIWFNAFLILKMILDLVSCRMINKFLKKESNVILKDEKVKPLSVESLLIYGISFTFSILTLFSFVRMLFWIDHKNFTNLEIIFLALLILLIFSSTIFLTNLMLSNEYLIKYLFIFNIIFNFIIFTIIIIFFSHIWNIKTDGMMKTFYILSIPSSLIFTTINISWSFVLLRKVQQNKNIWLNNRKESNKNEETN